MEVDLVKAIADLAKNGSSWAVVFVWVFFLAGKIFQKYRPPRNTQIDLIVLACKNAIKENTDKGIAQLEGILKHMRDWHDSILRSMSDGQVPTETIKAMMEWQSSTLLSLEAEVKTQRTSQENTLKFIDSLKLSKKGGRDSGVQNNSVYPS